MPSLPSRELREPRTWRSPLISKYCHNSPLWRKGFCGLPKEMATLTFRIPVCLIRRVAPVNESIKGCQEKTSPSTGLETLSRDPAHCSFTSQGSLARCPAVAQQPGGQIFRTGSRNGHVSRPLGGHFPSSTGELSCRQGVRQSHKVRTAHLLVRSNVANAPIRVNHRV